MNDNVLRKEYLNENPILEMEKWLHFAYENSVKFPNLMCLVTDIDGKITSRMVFLKRINDKGFIFFDSLEPDFKPVKNDAIINFIWRDISRNICIEGKLMRMERAIEEEHYQLLPKNLKLKYYVMNSKETVESRPRMKEIYLETEEKFEWEDIPMPENWGVYLFEPNYFEFINGNLLELPDKFIYRKENGVWYLARSIL